MAQDRVFWTMPAAEKGATHEAICATPRGAVVVLYRKDCDEDRHIRACVAWQWNVPNAEVLVRSTKRLAEPTRPRSPS